MPGEKTDPKLEGVGWGRFHGFKELYSKPRSAMMHLNKAFLSNKCDFIPATAQRRQFGYIWLDSKDCQGPLRGPGLSFSGMFWFLGSSGHFPWHGKRNTLTTECSCRDPRCCVALDFGCCLSGTHNNKRVKLPLLGSTEELWEPGCAVQMLCGPVWIEPIWPCIGWLSTAATTGLSDSREIFSTPLSFYWYTDPVKMDTGVSLPQWNLLPM